MNSLIPQRIEGLRTPRDANERTLRLCFTEQDAIVASINLSGLTLEEIGARCGVSKQAVAKWKDCGLPRKRRQAFQNATGTNLVRQWQDMDRAIREAAGKARERDRMAAIIAPTERAWGQAA